MKKLIVSLLLVGSVSAALAQGTVFFGTYNAGNTARGNVFLNGTSTGVPSSYVGEVWWSTALAGTYALVPSPAAQAFNPLGPGTINDGDITVNLLPGTVVYMQLRAWNGSASTFGSIGAITGLTTATPSVTGPYASGLSQYGWSIPVTRTLAGTYLNTDDEIVTVAPSSFNNFLNFQLTAIPEPSVIALAGLGLASLLIFRRRK